ncbi:hypothetical protein PspLS_09934 [Pyricularia sp. CBS 133598]|nr:hypothetical protein PspLS_09934 [Pyricularia sp. CBS 133598]
MQHTYFNLFLFTSASFFGQLYASQYTYNNYMGICSPVYHSCQTLAGTVNCPKEGPDSCKQGDDKRCMLIQHTGWYKWKDDIVHCDMTVFKPKDVEFFIKKENERLEQEKRQGQQ